MTDIKLPLKLKLNLAISSVVFVLSRPAYLVSGLAGGALAMGLLVWLTNLSLLWSVLNSGISPGEKINFYLEGYKSLFTNFEPMAAVVIVLFSLLFAVNLALLIFVLGWRSQATASDSGRSLAGIAAGAIGAGCAACGTSILAPVISSVGATASLSLVSWIGIIANTVGLSLLLYSIYRLGFNAATPIAKLKSAGEKNHLNRHG